jgi:glucose-1-phosphate cytidylyltransferase
MKVVILAGGLGSRLAEETGVRPKPMVEIGDKPILWHVMKMYHAYGMKEFVICCGYKGFLIKEYFASYLARTSDITYDGRSGSIEVHRRSSEDWRVTLIDTGESTMTGGRLKRVADRLDDGTFCMTYGDGLSNIDIGQLVRFHKEQGTHATLTAVQPPGRFGAFSLAADQVHIEHFREKPGGDNAWINGGFFVLEPEALDYIAGDDTIWEREPMERLAADGQLSAYRHSGFWHPMDTLRDRMDLEGLWKSSQAPWKIW